MTTETHETVSATELARNLSAVIDRVRLSRRSLYITKGAQTVAELSPPPPQGLQVEELARLLSSLPRLGKDNAALKDDIKSIRAHGKLPANPWD